MVGIISQGEAATHVPCLFYQLGSFVVQICMSADLHELHLRRFVLFINPTTWRQTNLKKEFKMITVLREVMADEVCIDFNWDGRFGKIKKSTNMRF